jgi:hypothetical protein
MLVSRGASNLLPIYYYDSEWKREAGVLTYVCTSAATIRVFKTRGFAATSAGSFTKYWQGKKSGLGSVAALKRPFFFINLMPLRHKMVVAWRGRPLLLFSGFLLTLHSAADIFWNESRHEIGAGFAALHGSISAIYYSAGSEWVLAIYGSICG